MSLFSRKVTKAAFLTMAFFVPTLVMAQTYSGPKCLGPFCLDRKLSFDSLSERLGPPNKYSRSYRSQDKSTFLTIGGTVESFDVVGRVTLGDSSFVKSADESLLTVTKDELSAWKTVEGIGLGSSVEDVLKTFGKPSGEVTLISEEHGASIETKRLSYKGLFNEGVAGAYFEIRSGKVRSIELQNEAFAGPECIGPSCMHGGSSLCSVLAQLGSPAQKPLPSGLYCYQSQSDEGFLYLVTGHEHEPPQIEAVSLSDFPYCAHKPETSTRSDLHAWKTPEGIGLGGSEEDVLRTYGKPSKVAKPGSKTASEYAELIRGYKKGDRLPDMGEKTLLYDARELGGAEFGIRDGKVLYIWISNEE
jgi:hypothetical protein